MASQFQFTTPPGVIGAALQARISRIPAALNDLGTSFAARMQSTMQENRPWTDQTGHARDSLYGEAVREGDNTTIYVYTTADYGPYLEFGTAPHAVNHPGTRPYPIIMPTLQQYQTEIVETAARKIVDALVK